jgi:hypothetical protein
MLAARPCTAIMHARSPCLTATLIMLSHDDCLAHHGARNQADQPVVMVLAKAERQCTD